MQQGSRDDASIVPYMGLRCDKAAVSRLVVYPTIDRRGGIYPARRRVSEANRRAAAALRPEIPPVEPRAATNRADMESAPTGVVISRDPRFPKLAARKKMKKFLIPHS